MTAPRSVTSLILIIHPQTPALQESNHSLWPIHKNLRFKNSITRFKNSITRSGCDGGTAHHPQQPALQEFNHSLQEFNHSLWFRRCGTVHHPQKPALQEFNQSLLLRRWCSAPPTATCASRIQPLASRIQSLALVAAVVQCTIHKHLRFKNSFTRAKNSISRSCFGGGAVHHPQSLRIPGVQDPPSGDTYEEQQSEQQQQEIETERTGSYGYSDSSYSKTMSTSRAIFKY
jgi:hypothetical protein